MVVAYLAPATMSRPKPTIAARNAYLDPLHSIGYLSRINFRAFSKALEQLTVKRGITAGQWRFLRVLWEEDEITQRELSDRVGTSEATTVRSVAVLVNNGLAVRKHCSEDKRKVLIVLTAKAQRLKKDLIPMVIEVNERAVAGLSAADIATTRRVLAHTHTNLVSGLKKA